MPSETDSMPARRSDMFSPMVAIRCVSSPCTSRPVPGYGAAATLARSPPLSSAIFAASPTNFWKMSLRPTKSVSALTSMTAPRVPLTTTPTRPSAATRPAFLAAADRPLVRSQSIAFSRSPATSPSAFLQSIMPAPVFSRSSLTREAVISAMSCSVSHQFDVAGCSQDSDRGGTLIGRRLAELADVTAGSRDLGTDAVEHCTRQQLAVERDRADGVVVARDRIVDAVGIGVAVEHRHDRDAALARFLDRDRFLVGVDDEQHVGRAAHFLDAAQRALELVALAREVELLFLGKADYVALQALIELAQALDRGRDGLPVGDHAAQPAVVDVVLAAALGRIGDALGGGGLGADEQHAAAVGHDLADLQQRLLQQRDGLGEIDDMDPVAHPEQVRLHLGVPTPGVVTEMDTRFQQLTHRKCRHSHAVLLFRLGLRGRRPLGQRLRRAPERAAGCLPVDRKPACEVGVVLEAYGRECKCNEINGLKP